MAKMTLLQLVQNILSYADSDEVTNIDDTAESEQVVDCIETVYRQLTENDNVPELNQLFQLTVDTGNTTFIYPTTMERLYWINYDKQKSGATDTDFQRILYRSPDDFLCLTNGRNSGDSDVESIAEPGGSGVNLLIENDKAPDFWTSFDDEHIVFDSYDSAVDASGLTAAKTQAWGKQIPTFTKANATVLTLGDNMYPYLLAEAKSLFMAGPGAAPSVKLESDARGQSVKIQNDRWRNDDRDPYTHQYPDYGRRGSRIHRRSR